MNFDHDDLTSALAGFVAGILFILLLVATDIHH